MNLTLVETRTFPDGVVLTRYETRRWCPTSIAAGTRHRAGWAEPRAEALPPERPFVRVPRQAQLRAR